MCDQSYISLYGDSSLLSVICYCLSERRRGVRSQAAALWSRACCQHPVCASEPSGSFTLLLLEEFSAVAPLLIWIRALLICLVSLCTLAEWPRTRTGTDTETHRTNGVTPHERMLVTLDSDKIKKGEREREKNQ